MFSNLLVVGEVISFLEVCFVFILYASGQIGTFSTTCLYIMVMIYSATLSATCLFLYKPTTISHFYFLRFRDTTFVS